MHKVALIHLGCPKNLVDSEVLLGYLGEEFEITNSLEVADIVVINTCGFIEIAKQEAIDTILKASDLKERNCQALIVTGCLAQRYGNELLKEMPEIDGILGVEQLPHINEVIQKALRGQRPLFIDRTGYLVGSMPRIRSTPMYTAYLKIAEGCLNRCAYCAIPLIRGSQRSRTLEDIISEAKRLVQEGVKEITLVAQDTTAYGLDLTGSLGLSELLLELGTILPQDIWLRSLYSYPTRLTPEIINAFAQVKQYCHYIDLPLQHISEKVLYKMGRPFNKEQTYKLINNLRESMPDIVLRTTFMVGYPGENEEDFNELLEFMDTVKFDHVGVFAFSPEEGTKAYDLTPVVPSEVALERLNKAMKLQQSISKTKNLTRIGQVYPVLVMGKSDESELVYTGRTRFQAPEIDGFTYFGLPDGPIKPGDIILVRITQALEYDLAGEVIAL